MLSTGLGIPAALMYASLIDQDINCRAVGRCTYGDIIDRELLDMVPREGPDEGTHDERRRRPPIPLSTDLGRAFLYARYNVDLSDSGLAGLGLGRLDAATLRKMDRATPEHIEQLLQVGGAAARQVSLAHFGPFAP